MNTSVADDMIRSYFDRWQRLEEEKRTISDDLKELFAEARGNGLDTKALRAVFREQAGDKAAIEEFDAICDLYRASLNAPRAGRARESQSYAEAKGVERTELEDTVAALREVSRQNGANFDGYDAETRTFPAERELTDTQEQPIDPARDEPEGEADASGDFERDTRQSVPADLTDGNIVTDGSSRSANSPSPANAPRLAADDEAAQANPTSSAPHSNPQPAASLGNADTAGAASSSTAPATPQQSATKRNHSGYGSDPLLLNVPREAVTDQAWAAVPQPSVAPATLSEKKDCLKLKDGHCKISFETSALCSECNRAKAEKARAA